MKKDVLVPEIGESVSSGVLASWLKKSGDAVEEGEEIFELETDKATLAVPAPAAGVLEITVAEDTEVAVGRTVATIETDGAVAAPADGQAAQPAQSSEASETTRKPHEAAPEPEAATEGPGNKQGHLSDDGSAPALSPAVRRVVEEHGLNPFEIQGSGPGGRITKEDALKAAEHGRSDATTTPAARVSQTADETGRETRRKLSSLRRRIAENLVASQQSSAHLTTFNEVDMSAVMELRARHREQFEETHRVKLGFMSFFIKAAQRALEAYPELNGRIDGDEIVYHNYYNIGVALSSDRGLITPVVRDVDRKSFAAIESEILSFITRAQQKKLMPDELTGGTFTISNGGVFGSMLSTPIPSPPQSGVLGMHSIQKRPVAINDAVVIRPMMYLALTYDHRIVDGREAIKFLVAVKQQIEDPGRMLLGL